MTDQRAIAQRDYILGYCDRMRVEDHRIFRRELVEGAWPQDAVNMPVECLRGNLGDKFRVYERPNGEVEVHRIG